MLCKPSAKCIDINTIVHFKTYTYVVYMLQRYLLIFNSLFPFSKIHPYTILINLLK